MHSALSEDLGYGITRIDAGYVEPGLACFYLLQSGDACAVIETGTVYSVPGLLSLMEERGIDPEQVQYVIPTHVHLDHAGGAGLMMRHFPRARLLAHPRGARHLVDPTKLVAGSREVYGDELFDQLYGDIVPVDESRVHVVEDGETLRLGERALEFRHTPGHADHHFCVWDATSGGWFTGDVFGISYAWFRTPGGDFVMPSTTPPQFRPDELKASLALLDSYGPQRVYLTHYGALEYTSQQRDALVEQIDRYMTLAFEGEGDGAAIEASIIRYSADRVRAMNPGQALDGMQDKFKHDASLNAQGLAVWHQRQQA